MTCLDDSALSRANGLDERLLALTEGLCAVR
jgi:hypothetical protein